MFVPRHLGARLEKSLPRSFVRLLHRIYDPYHRWVVQGINRRLLARLFATRDLVITAGPLQGMKYLPLSSAGSALLPKLLGAYEEELHGALRDILGRNYDTIIDVGCAEGYYLVGLAWKLPRVKALGFDLDQSALTTCRRLAELNQTGNRVELRGACTPSNLEPLLGGKALIICDCEGYEAELLDPAKVPGLKRADILVELHERLVPGVTSLIRERFAASHEVNLIPTQPRDPRKFPLLASLSPEDQRLALEEFRGGPMDWAWMKRVDGSGDGAPNSDSAR